MINNLIFCMSLNVYRSNTVSIFLSMFSFAYQHANIQCDKVACNRIPTCDKPKYRRGLCCKTCPGDLCNFAFRSVGFAQFHSYSKMFHKDKWSLLGLLGASFLANLSKLIYIYFLWNLMISGGQILINSLN